MIALATLFVITTYCPSRACGALDHGITSSGRHALEGRTVACPPEMPFGTRLLIERVGFRTCEDRGSAIKGARLDLFVGAIDEEPDRGRRRALLYWRDRGIQPTARRVKLRVCVLWMPGQHALNSCGWMTERR